MLAELVPGASLALLQGGWEPVIRNTIVEGLLYVGLALGLYLALRVVGFPDLTVEGSFAWGGAIAAVTIVQWEWSPVTGTLAAFVGGMIPGVVTGVLNRYLYLTDLIAGIVTATLFYTLTRRITGAATQPLLGEDIFNVVEPLSPSTDDTAVLATGLVIIVVIVVLGVRWLLSTQIGLAMRSTGSSEPMATSVGISASLMVVLALALGNGLTALSGALVVQRQGFSDVNMGVGVIVAGLGTVMLGEALTGKSSVWRGVIACVIGSFAYRFIIAFALAAGLQPTDIRGASAVLLVVILVLPNAGPLARKMLRHGSGPSRPQKTVLRRR